MSSHKNPSNMAVGAQLALCSRHRPPKNWVGWAGTFNVWLSFILDNCLRQWYSSCAHRSTGTRPAPSGLPANFATDMPGQTVGDCPMVFPHGGHGSGGLPFAFFHPAD